jgi:hypothetical protein
MKAIAAALALTLSGCFSHGVMVSEEGVQKIKRGETTEPDVIAALGRPTTISTTNGRRILVYSGAVAQARPASFIPIIGPLVGGTDVRASMVMVTVVNGVVTDISSTQTETGSGSGLASGAPIERVANQPRRD